jgi:hypothetical protein
VSRYRGEMRRRGMREGERCEKERDARRREMKEGER